LVGAFGLVLVAAVGLAVLRLVRGRGRVVATIGGLLLVIGGTAATTGQFMYGAVLTAMAVGFPGIMLGLLVSAGALLRSRAVPRWVPAAMVFGSQGSPCPFGGARLLDGAPDLERAQVRRQPTPTRARAAPRARSCRRSCR
jgi:hypothetical protein